MRQGQSLRLRRRSWFSALPLNRQSLLRWSSKGFWAVSDQGLFAVSNLLVNVILARSLPRAEYGAFATAYTVLLLVNVVHSALISEPMLVFGADRYGASFSHYFRILLRYHWLLTLGISACLGVTAVVLTATTSGSLGQAAAGLTVVAPFILLNWLVRRACYVVSRPRLAALGGALNLTVVIIGTIVLARLRMLSVFSGQLIVGAAALAATGLMMRTLLRVTDRAARRRGPWHDLVRPRELRPVERRVGSVHLVPVVHLLFRVADLERAGGDRCVQGRLESGDADCAGRRRTRHAAPAGIRPKPARRRKIQTGRDLVRCGIRDRGAGLLVDARHFRPAAAGMDLRRGLSIRAADAHSTRDDSAAEPD